MTVSHKELEHIARLAYLKADSKQADTLAQEINSIMNFVEQLRAIDTKNVAPLSNPLDLHQRFRIDEVNEEDCLAQLEELASQFDQGLYLVPTVIDSGK